MASSFRERQSEKNKALIKRKPVTLPETGEKIVVRTLMGGDLMRIRALGEAEQGIATIAFAVEEPEKPGVPVYNWNDLTHRQEIAEWHPKDMEAVVTAHNDMMGVAANPQ